MEKEKKKKVIEKFINSRLKNPNKRNYRSGVLVMVGNKNQQKEEMKHSKHQNWEVLLSFHYPWPLEKALCDLL